MACSRIIDDPVFSSSLELKPPEILSHLNCDLNYRSECIWKRGTLLNVQKHEEITLMTGVLLCMDINSGKDRLQMRGRSYNLCAEVWLVILSWLPGAHKDIHLYSSGQGGRNWDEKNLWIKRIRTKVSFTSYCQGQKQTWLEQDEFAFLQL